MSEAMKQRVDEHTLEEFYSKSSATVAVVCSCGFATKYANLGTSIERVFGLDHFDRMHEAHITAAKAEIREARELLNKPIDNYTIQSCCLAYGGNSFSGPMQKALETHLSILRNALPDTKEQAKWRLI